MSTKVKILFVIIVIIIIGAARHAYRKSPPPQSAAAKQHEEAVKRIESNLNLYRGNSSYNINSNTSTGLKHRQIKGIRTSGST